jgi:hypothetical protein
MSGLDVNTYYPVTIGLPAARPTRMRIQNGLNSNTPSWSTHPSGFSVLIEWTSNGFGWGTIPVTRAVTRWVESFTNVTIVGGITQLGNNSEEVIWLRGGGDYYFEADQDVAPVIRTTSYTIHGQTASPSASVVNSPWNQTTSTYGVGNLYVGGNLALHAGNYNSYSPSLTGGNASGTWGITITGNSGNTSSISNAVGGGYTWTGIQYFRSNRNTSSDSPPLQAFSDNGSGAIMSFHRGGYYAVNFGLDSDNVMRIGGWSAAANRWQLDMSGNGTYAGNVTAYSDERLKTNWQPMPDDYVARLAQVKVGIYDRIDEKEMSQVGVSAQSLQRLLPQAIMTAKDEMQTLSVNYGSAALASAVELAKRVVDQEKRIAHLESLINKLIGD